MVEVGDLLVRPVARALLFVAQALWWLTFELLVETVAWSIGWPICRALSGGRFPDTEFRDLDETTLWARIVVEVVGLIALGAAIWVLSRVAGQLA